MREESLPQEPWRLCGPWATQRENPRGPSLKRHQRQHLRVSDLFRRKVFLLNSRMRRGRDQGPTLFLMLAAPLSLLMLQIPALPSQPPSRVSSFPELCRPSELGSQLLCPGRCFAHRVWRGHDTCHTCADLKEAALRERRSATVLPGREGPRPPYREHS